MKEKRAKREDRIDRESSKRHMYKNGIYTPPMDSGEGSINTCTEKKKERKSYHEKLCTTFKKAVTRVIEENYVQLSKPLSIRILLN